MKYIQRNMLWYNALSFLLMHDSTARSATFDGETPFLCVEMSVSFFEKAWRPEKHVGSFPDIMLALWMA